MRVCISLFQFFLLSAVCQWPQARADYPSNGMSLDYCRKNEDCAGSRQCYYIKENEGTLCNASTFSCLCRTKLPRECSSSAECPDGERCFVLHSDDSQGEHAFCWTCRLSTSNANSYLDENPSNCKNVWLGGYTGDICSTAYYECAGERTCQELLEDGSPDRCSFTTKPCFCWPQNLKACSSSQECANGERCAKDGKGVTACFSCGRVEADDTFTAIDKDAICTTPSPTITATPSPTPTVSPTPSASLVIASDNESVPSSPAPLFSPAPIPACIAVVHLLRVEVRDLIFRDHIRAAVLCDRRDSCATPGHMVIYNHVPMSMHSYCSRYTKCIRRIALVNNPRMRRGFRLASNTDGLQFTVFSARHETRLEESLLRLAISFGM